ncbi:MAG: hypothetical protein ACI4AX_02850 [Muribaculaceae bacterium]
MAQDAPVVTKTWAIEKVAIDGWNKNEFRFGTGSNGKVYTVNKAGKQLVSISPDGITTVDLSAYAPGVGITTDQAGNILINQSFPNAASGTDYIIVPADGSDIKPLTLTYPEGIKAARIDQIGRIVGNILSEEGGAWYLTPNGSKVVGIAYVQNGAQAPLLDYMTTEEFAAPIVNTSTIAQPLAENITEFMDLGDEAVNAFCIRNRTTKSVYDMSTGVGDPQIYTSPASANTQEGFDVFTLGGVTYQVVPTMKAANYESHFAIADTEGNVIYESDYEFAGDGGQSFGGFTAHKVSDTKVELYQWFSSGAGAIAAMYTIEIPGEPAKQVYSYFADDFEWLAPWSAYVNDKGEKTGDTVGKNDASEYCPQLQTPKVEGKMAYTALIEKGYNIVTSYHAGKNSPRDPWACTYLQENYLKFGLTGYYAGLTLPKVKNVPAGANVKLSFDFSSQKQGSGVWDETKLVVIVKNGEDVKTFDVPVKTPEVGGDYAWFPMEVELTGATIDANTEITIRPCDEQWPSTASSPDALRWYIDNINLAGDVEPLPVMPDLYLRGDFNEWGITVPMVLAEEKPEGYDGAYTVTLESLPAGELKVGNADWSVSVGAGDNPAITLGAELEALNNGQNFKLADELIDATITLYYNVKPDAKSMLKVEGTKGHRFAGKGTADEPYLIATPADLCAIYTLNDGRDWKEFYFKQTADIDMAGVEVYHTIAGHNGLYQSVIHYDGDFHAIKNFGPKDAAANNANSTCYITSIFGVPTGTIKNLGVIDAKVETAQGAGVLGAYAGQSGHPLTVENVYVTGSVKGTGGYTGGLFGTTGAELTLNNVYFNGSVEGSGFTGGLVGRLRNPLILNNAYVAGTVTAADAAKGALIASSDKSNIDVMANNFVAFNSGVENVTVGCTVTGEIPVATAETKDALVSNVKRNWKSYSECRELAGYPALNWQKNCGFAPVTLAGKGTADDPYQIATVADLCSAYAVNDGRDWKEFYFKQTADIDMAGVEVYHTIAGHNGLYQSVIHYDGDFHAIKNFGPKDAAANNANSTCYITSIFGVPTGTIKNLGVIDAKVETAQGAGVLGAYAGQSGHPLTVENVYVTGSVKGTGGYTGGLFGTTGAELTLNNVYFNGTVEGSGFTGGLVGRLRNELALNNTYAAGTVTAADAAKGALVAASDKTDIPVKANSFVAFNSGIEAVTVGCAVTGEIPVATDETKEALVNNIKKNWEAYNECRELAGYPAFNWQKECGVVALPLPARAAMAYGLAIAANGNDNYSITFKATEAGQAAITFTNQADATDVVTIELGAVTKGENTVGVSTGDLKGGTYNWAIDIISNIEGEAPVLVYAGETPEQMVRGGVVTITDETVPAYGYTIVAHGKWQGFDVYDPEGEHVGTFHKGFKQSTNQSAPFRGAEREGLAVFADWSDATAGYWVVDPLNPTAEPYNLLAAPGATVAGSGLYTTAEGVITAGGSAAIAFQGKGDDTVMYGFEEDRPDASNVVVAWPIGSAQYLTVAPKMIFSGVAPAEGSNIPTNEGGVNTKSKFANTNVDILAIENGFFASQIRANGKEVGTPPFMYITNDGQEGYNAGLEEIMESSSAGIAITKDRSVFAASMNDAIRFFSVEWDENGFPVMAKLADVEVPGLRWAQMRFDAANNLHVYARECGGYRVYALNGEGTATTAAPAEMAVTKVPDGISDIAVDAANGDAVYYNLNGVRIAADNLVPGVYVKVVNGKATKVVVK